MYTNPVGSFVRISAIFFIAALCVISVHAQSKSATPRQEKLLNGLKVLMWPEPAAERITLKVRIHRGTAFDPQGKEGVMSLLAESFFPNETTREFFREDLGGGLEIRSTYDYLQISAWGRPDEFLNLLEAVSSAVNTPSIDKETTPKLVAERLAKIRELENDPAYLADAAASKQLFGKFPYGRPELGTVASVEKLNFADVLDAKQRFLTADNATLSISGKIDPALAYRAARRYFGSWLKSDRLPPSTFEQPEAPDTKMVNLTGSAERSPHQRFALRGVSRGESDYAASEILEAILDARVKENLTGASQIYVTNDAHFLPGSLAIGATIEGETVPANLVTLLLSKAVTTSEFNAAKARVIADRGKLAVDEFWLDVDTYKLKSAADDAKAFEAATIADVQRVAERLAKNPVVAVIVSAPEKPATTEN